jgi:hypothetical protein
VNDATDRQAAGVDEDAACPAFYLLAGVEAAHAATFGGLDRLAVDDAGARAGLPVRGLMRGDERKMVDGPPG